MVIGCVVSLGGHVLHLTSQVIRKRVTTGLTQQKIIITPMGIIVLKVRKLGEVVGQLCLTYAVFNKVSAQALLTTHSKWLYLRHLIHWVGAY